MVHSAHAGPDKYMCLHKYDSNTFHHTSHTSHACLQQLYGRKATDAVLTFLCIVNGCFDVERMFTQAGYAPGGVANSFSLYYNNFVARACRIFPRTTHTKNV